VRRVLLVLLCFGVAACPAPTDVTPLIHVDPHAAQRLSWLAHPGPSAQAPQSHPSRVHVMKEGEQLGGPNAIGRPGDLLLENDQVAFVIDQLGSSAGFAETGGNLVDAADAHERKDELGQLFAYFGVFPRQGVYATLTSRTDADGSAWAEARGSELYEPKVAVTTRYTLHPPDRALFIETTLENGGDAPVEIPGLGDAVQWGGAEKVAPGKPRGFKGPSSGPYVGGDGRFASYALTSTDGVVDGVSGGSWTDTVQRKGVKLAPREKTSYARVFLVGERPDTSSLVGELTMVSGQAVGQVKVVPSSTVVGDVLLTPQGGAESLTLAAPFEATLPPGRYFASVSGGARVGPVEVKAGEQSSVDLPVVAPATVAVRCADTAGVAMPCKVTVEGLGTTALPDFGPAHAAGPARNQATTADGSVSLQLLPGTYRITASRGPEYALAQTDVTLAAGGHAEVSLAPKRVVDTWGYLGCDFHQHTMLGADAPTSLRDRIVSNVAEGVEVAVASEHNVVADLEPAVRQMHLDAALVQIPGDELTTDASKHPWGHANAWPMPAATDQPRGGAPLVRDRSPHDLVDELRGKLHGDWVFQINHPRSGINGYFDQLGFDPAKGTGSDPGYDARFDAIEVWNGRNTGPRQKVLADWTALLRSGHPVTPTADTDTHGVVGQEPGYPRTYVRVSDDGQLEHWDAARTADLVRGVKTLRDVVLTNGPMLRVSVSGAPVGGVARGRKVVVKVHVECAPWVDVDTVRVLRARAAPDDPGVSRSVTLADQSGGARAVDLDVPVTLQVDDALYVVASGSKPMTPVLSGDPADITPWAMTGAIWVDADGDGKSLGVAVARTAVALPL
jgi:hypothetical protein